MTLATQTAPSEGPETRPPLIVAHGLFGQARNWAGIARRLAQGRRVVACDMRHHGANPPMAPGGYEDMGGDLAALVAAEGAADLLGHSMGGKAAMACALLHRPAGLRRLVVADIAPVAYGGRDHLPYIRAMQALDLAAIQRRSQAEAALAEAVPDRPLRLFLVQNLEITPRGARWRLDLPALAQAMPRIMDFPDVDAVWPGPALFLAGGAADYLTPAHHPRIRALFPAAQFDAIPGAGHWLHAEAPEAFVDRVAAFLSD